MIDGALSWIRNRVQASAPEPAERIAPTLGIVNAGEQYVLSDREAMAEIFHLPSYAGPPVTTASAMRVTAVYACITLIAGAIASMPVGFFQRTDDSDGRKRVKHPLWWLFNGRPSPLIPAAVFWEYVIATKILHGDGFALIVRNRMGEILELVPLSPLEVATERVGNQIVYVVNSPDLGKPFGVNRDDMLHFHGFGFNTRTGRGLSVIQHVARQAIGNALGADEFAGRFMANSAQPAHVITFPAGVKDEQITALKERWAERRAGVVHAGKPLILTNGATVKELTMTLEDAQLLETRRFTVEDIARALGVPPFMIGATDKTTSWGSGVEHMGQGFVTFTLTRHLNPAEQEIEEKCIRDQTHFVEFNVNGLLRADLKGRGDYYRQAVGGSQGPGWLTVNEIRRLENEESDDDGDELFKPTAAQVAAPKPGDNNEPKPAAA